MNILGNLYVDNNSYLHQIDGSVKLLFLIVWSYLIFAFNDIRIFLFAIIIGYSILISAKLPKKIILSITTIMIIFTLFNSLTLLIITPTYGSDLAQSTTEAFSIGYAVVTYETLFYILTLSTKYIALLPATLIFILTTNPAKFAASLNKIKVPYKVAYAVSVTLRYIPTIGEDFIQIKHALELKGIKFKYKNPFKLLKAYTLIFSPLIRIAIHKIDLISDGMELREFGKYRKRTWYESRKFQFNDYIVLTMIILIFGVATYFWIINPPFFYPFN